LYRLLYCILGCEGSIENKPEETGVIMPLKVGNQWNYKAFVIDSNGQQMAGQQISIPIKVLRDTTINGSTWYILNSFFDKEKLELLQYKQDGVWFGYNGVEGILFRYPAQANSSYAAPDGGIMQLISTNASVTVPVGTFSTYEYRIARLRMQ